LKGDEVMQDTIAAISTALGVGAISIIRISGRDAIENVEKIFSRKLKDKKTHTIHYGYIKEKEEIIDEVLVTIMHAPKTFTTEDVVEINCHGGIAVTKKVLSLLLKNGCRLAEPGEFTKRAFLNGRIDLTEAQAIMDLINVKSESERKIAIHNLKGKTKTKIESLRNKILDILSNIEVNIDYPEYLDIEEITNEKIKSFLFPLKKELEKIIENSKNARWIREGIKTTIIGRPNVGKSSILNELLQEEKAIVTDIPGTTRDTVEATLEMDGILLNLIDTAGIRETEDIVEKIGVDRSKQTIEDADLVILVLNSHEQLTKEDQELLEITQHKNRIVVLNKNDLKSVLKLPEDVKNIVRTSTIFEDGLEPLKEKIKELFHLDMLETKDYNYLSNINQIEKLEEIKEILDNIEIGLETNIPIDMIEIDLKEIFQLLGEILGINYQEELLDHLFKNFCVGK